MSKGYFNMARVYEVNDKPTLASDYYEKVLICDPNDYKSLVNLAVLKEKGGLHNEAITLLERATKLGGRKAHLNISITYLQQGLFSESDFHIQRAYDLSDKAQKEGDFYEKLLINRVNIA